LPLVVAPGSASHGYCAVVDLRDQHDELVAA
jgi:hypothetical protein